ncbi:MAG: tripartite tricarboxylate transporter TctB family protein [Polaromonas sp.]|uniref:tripartite tricarboxylate transporter TctB family protein n=1 Tax=Polaromonas sp. TaxID=1869339 RepID=UPI002732CD90|nr:tripartite tricarboxylate transporter TctB family protein [Polaromonas sp.]MDP3798735.1 tripartite tricarboxylate transporter TctB family protein [Polaromonas sp.]
MHNPRLRLVGELSFTLLLVGFSLFMLWQAYAISKFESITSAGSFPMFVTALMVITGLIIVGQTARSKPLTGEADESALQQFTRQITPGVVVSFTLLIAVYMALLGVLGFVVSSYLFLVVSMWLLGSRRVVLNLVVSALSLAAIYVIFQTVFSVVLPTSSLFKGFMS